MQISPQKTIWLLTELDSLQSYRITKIVRALWLAERHFCMRVCKHGLWQQDVLLFACKHEFEKGFELKNSSSLLYLPISSSVETWKIFRNMQCQCFFARADILSKKNSYFGKHLLCKTRTDYVYKLRVQDFATGKNFSFNQCSEQESFAFCSWKLFYKSNRKLFSCLCKSW